MSIEPERDPRVYFAAERTLLAWVRTGVTLVGLGFVVARFGLFLRMINAAHPALPERGVSTGLGVALAMGGAVVTALATVQFALFVRDLPAAGLPRPRLTHYLSLVLGVLASALGVVLGLYLL
jgi:putative membrane protein